MGNSSSSPSTRRKKCSFCHSNSCKGDSNCQFIFGEKSGQTSNTGVRYVSSNSMVAPTPTPSSYVYAQKITGTDPRVTKPSTVGVTSNSGSRVTSVSTERVTCYSGSKVTTPSTAGFSNNSGPRVTTVPTARVTSNSGDGAVTSKLSQSGSTVPNPFFSGNKAPDTNKTDSKISSPSLSPQNIPFSSTNPFAVSNQQQEVGISKVTPDLDIRVKSQVSKPSSLDSAILKHLTVLCNELSERQPKFTHSSNAVKYEGVVYQILGSRNAKVRVAERNGVPVKKLEWGAAGVVHKYALLVVDKLLNDESGSFYLPHTPITDVLSKGDVIGLICTPHNNQSSGFQLYTHEAWVTGIKSEIDDNDSVASKSGSETQGSTTSKASKRKVGNNNSKDALNEEMNNVGDAVSQWLDSNQYCLNSNENSKPLKLIGGCHYIGKAIEIRPPHGFIVEISSKEGRQFIFVPSNYFCPQGFSAPALSDGTSLKVSVNIGDEIVVSPIKNVAMQEGKFEWIASKAWPKSIQSPVTSSNLNALSQGAQFIGPEEKLEQEKDSVTKKADLQEDVNFGTYIKTLCPSAKTWREFDGEILSLQYNWGLVKEKVNSQAAYIFTRDIAYLFGLNLQHFILDDVFKLGQKVKFALDVGEPGTMNALAVWWGNKLPDYNSFDIATGKYCEENVIKLATEDSLIQHGKAMYLGH